MATETYQETSQDTSVKEASVPPFKKGEKLDTIIAHWTMFAPGKSGMYETVKELVKYENRMPGVLAGLVEPQDKPDCKAGGKVDPIDTDIVTQTWNWGLQEANVHMVHFTAIPYGLRLRPKIFMIHGQAESSLYSELDPAEHKFSSFNTAAQFLDVCDASICLHKREYYYYKQFDHGHKLNYIRRGVDLERWKPEGMKMNLNGKPSITFGEVWRIFKDPMHLMFAAYEYHKKNPDMKLHLFGCTYYPETWERMMFAGGFHEVIGRYGIGGHQSFPEHWFRGSDMVFSPNMIGAESRVAVEAMACGCPVVGWDTDSFGDFQMTARAKPFDVFDLVDKFEKVWGMIQDNPEKVRAECAEYAKKNFDMAHTAALVVQVCRNVLATKGGDKHG